MPASRPLTDRLWEKIDTSAKTPGSCWPFMGTRSRKGYGLIWSGKRGIYMVKTHRVVLKEVVGPLGKQHALHRCNNPSCCRPSHLYVGNNQDNVDDRNRASRQARGESNGRAKLTETQVRQIMADRRSTYAIAAEHGVSDTTVYNIKHRRKWDHLWPQETSPTP